MKLRLCYEKEHDMWAVEVRFDNGKDHKIYFEHRKEAEERYMKMLEE